MRVLDLMLQVLAAAVALGLARGATGVWRNTFDPWGGTVILGDGAVGAVTLALSVWLCVPLARRIVVLSRGREPLRCRLWPMAWRAAALLWLGWLAATESALLSRDTAPENPIPLQARWSLLPILGVLALVGITAGLAPAVPRPRRAPTLRWVIVPLAVLAGALLMAMGSTIPYLVLIAIDGVTIALTSRSGRVLPDVFMRDAPPLNARIVRAGWEALWAGVVCAAMGSVLARDLRRDLSAEPATGRAMLPRFLLLVATAYVGLRLVFVALPALHPSLLGGLRLVFEAINIAALAAGFAILAAGLTSRAVAPAAEPRAAHRPRRAHRRWAMFAGLVAVGLVSAGACLTDSDPTGLREFPWLLRTKESIMAVVEVLHPRHPGLTGLAPYLGFYFLTRVMVVTWLAILIARANLPGRASTPSALDLAVATRSRIAWFVWGTAGLTVACLAALPMFYLAGVSLLHLRLR